MLMKAIILIKGGVFVLKRMLTFSPVYQLLQSIHNKLIALNSIFC
ncbi:hypothetical protein H1P_60064 [Hyella patelloides LEGE 07179]|uniref:Uncharacterized protein n=1 Tax=Hyella patelloides LEGE 07179 TaxID=945734 RepID=A0A563W149_9CYAN|nr:hypothetical protein H1P_60064 [Hyella patelloides LEGE 07179]